MVDFAELVSKYDVKNNEENKAKVSNRVDKTFVQGNTKERQEQEQKAKKLTDECMDEIEKITDKKPTDDLNEIDAIIDSVEKKKEETVEAVKEEAVKEEAKKKTKKKVLKKAVKTKMTAIGGKDAKNNPDFEYEDEPRLVDMDHCEIMWAQGVTLNLGNFESIRYDISIKEYCAKEDKDKTLESMKEYCVQEIRKERTKIEKYRSNRPG